MANPWKNVSADEAYAEAQRRIAAARADGSTQLDLGDLPLEELPPEIGELKLLENLQLHHRFEDDWDDVGTGYSGTSLAPLAGLSSLKHLDLSSCEEFTDLRPLANLTALETLDLAACRLISDLRPIAGLSGLVNLDLSECDQIDDLTPIESLAALETLGLNWCYQITDLRPLERLTAVRSLSLLGCYQIQDLRSLEKLTALEDLMLVKCDLINIKSLSELGKLTCLDLSECNNVFDLEPLAGLITLTSLNLRCCEQVSDLHALSGLVAIESLDLFCCEQVADLQPLSGLTSLRSLNLHCCQQVQDLQALKNLTSLASLDLTACEQVTDLSPLANLASLASLDLTQCKQVKDLQPLAGLTELTTLSLAWCTQFPDLRPLAHLKHLTDLSLTGCQQVADLSPLTSLTSLSALYLAHCDQITDVQPLSELKSLEVINLSGCHRVTDLQPLWALLDLRELVFENAGAQSFEFVKPLLDRLYQLRIFNTQFSDLDENLQGTREFEDVIDKVRSHFEDLEYGQATETEVKVFVLGNGRIGKTQLVRRLMGDEFDESISSTHGIQCRHRTEGQLAGWKTVRVNFWDFGGQDIYHGSHALFLHGQAIFVLLWTPDKEAGEYVEGRMTMRNRPLAYWLDYVRTLAGTDCPVLVVQSQCDDRSCERPTPLPGTHDFEYLRDVKFSAKSKEDRGLEELKGLLREAASKVLTKYKGWTIGIGRADVRNQLRDWLEEDQKEVVTENRVHRVLKPAEYQKLCKSVNKQRPGSVSSPEALLDYLHQTGVVFYKPGLFGGRIILDQEWALGAIYTLFHRGEVLPHLVRDKGRFTRSLLNDLIWGRKVDKNGPYSIEEQELFLDMMQECGICFRVDRRDDNGHAVEPLYIAPELLPDWGAIRESEYHWTDNTPCSARATLRYRFLHEGVFRGLISKIGSQAGEGAHYGKQGCGFYDRKTHSTVLIEAVPLETAEHPGAGELRLHSWGPGGRALIETILKSVPSVAVVPPEIERSWDAEQGRSLMGVGGMLGGEETLTPGPSPRGRAEKEAGLEKLDARKQRVYLSYAWGEEGDAREKVASQIITKLDEWGYEAVFDKRAMRAGDRISEFMIEIAYGYKIVVIVSGKYVRSRYCVNELHSIFQRELREKREFLNRIVPIVLNDASVHDPEDRATHSEFWEKKQQALEAKKGNLGPSDLDLCRKYGDWTRDIGEILHLISDKLSPQNITELTELDFEKIRQMLGPTS